MQQRKPLNKKQKHTWKDAVCREILTCFYALLFVFCLTWSLWLSSTENVDYSSCNKFVIDSCCFEFKSLSVIFGVLCVRRGSRRLWIILLSYPGSSNNFPIILQQAASNVVWWHRPLPVPEHARLKFNITLVNTGASFMIQFKNICVTWKWL